MHCMECNAEIAEDAKFCGACGTKVISIEPAKAVPKFCGECGSKLGAGAKLCEACWTPAVSTGIVVGGFRATSTNSNSTANRRSQKSMMVALFLWFLGGALLGAHKFYLDRPGQALIQIGLFWGGYAMSWRSLNTLQMEMAEAYFVVMCLAGLWWAADLIWIATKSGDDINWE